MKLIFALEQICQYVLQKRAAIASSLQWYRAHQQLRIPNLLMCTFNLAIFFEVQS